MNTPGAKTIGLTADNEVKEPIVFKLQDKGLGGNNGGNGSVGGTVTPEATAAIQLRKTIGGGTPFGDGDPSAGTSDKAGTPFNPNADLIRTAEPDAHQSAMSDLIKPDAELNLANGGAEGVQCDPLTVAVVVAAVAVVGAIAGAVVYLGTPAEKPSQSQPIPLILEKKPIHKNETKDFYVNPESDTSGGEHNYPDANGNDIGQTQSVPSGLGLSLDLINSLTGGNLTFGKSGPGKLDLFGKTDDKGSGGQGAYSGGGKTIDSGSGGGSSNEIKGAAPSGGSVAPPTGLDALLLQFGVKDLDANLKDGSFDLDNFSAGLAGLRPDQDFALDLDGNGKQDMIEWAIDTVITSAEEQQTIADLFQDSSNYADYAEMEAAFRAYLAEYHIA